MRFAVWSLFFENPLKIKAILPQMIFKYEPIQVFKNTIPEYICFKKISSAISFRPPYCIQGQERAF